MVKSFWTASTFVLGVFFLIHLGKAFPVTMLQYIKNVFAMYFLVEKCPSPLLFCVWGQVAQSHILASGHDSLLSNLLTVCSG